MHGDAKRTTELGKYIMTCMERSGGGGEPPPLEGPVFPVGFDKPARGGGGGEE